MDTEGKKLKFNTAIITYPSDYNGSLTIQSIIEKYKEIMIPTTKVVIAKEEADEEIQRDHYHLYWDDKKQKQVRTNYFDIDLPQPMIVFIHPDKGKTREYKYLSELESQLGWDNGEEMVAKLDMYVKEHSEEYASYEILTKAHPNIQLKREWGDKYFMLRYVVKQKLLVRTNFNIEEELKYLQENCDELYERANELIQQNLLSELNIKTVDELIILLKKYKESCKRKKRTNRKNGRKGGEDNPDYSTAEWDLCQLIRRTMYENEGITKNEMLKKIKECEEWWFIYASKYVNYNKLLNDLFKDKPLAKPKRNYNFKFWLPRQLFDYIQWLDQWVMNWTTGQKDKCEHRPKGLVLIGGSRTGKTSLMSLIGEFTYFKNIWNSDNWEYLPPYTIMDDMDAQDEGKGLSFSWFKPWFGAQDAITITDKYRPKEDIFNGKPLIWLNNYDIEETFKSKTAQDYIKKNMIYVNIGNQKLYEKPEPFEWIEGHSDYVEWDPKSTWFYQNVVLFRERGYTEDVIRDKINVLKEKASNSNTTTPVIDVDVDDIDTDSNKENVDPNASTSTHQPQELIWINETDKLIEKFEEIEPLADRQKRIHHEQERGRPNKRIRSQNKGKSRSYE